MRGLPEKGINLFQKGVDNNKNRVIIASITVIITVFKLVSNSYSDSISESL